MAAVEHVVAAAAGQAVSAVAALQDVASPATDQGIVAVGAKRGSHPGGQAAVMTDAVVGGQLLGGVGGGVKLGEGRNQGLDVGGEFGLRL